MASGRLVGQVLDDGDLLGVASGKDHDAARRDVRAFLRQHALDRHLQRVERLADSSLPVDLLSPARRDEDDGLGRLGEERRLRTGRTRQVQ